MSPGSNNVLIKVLKKDITLHCEKLLFCNVPNMLVKTPKEFNMLSVTYLYDEIINVVYEQHGIPLY